MTGLSKNTYLGQLRDQYPISKQAFTFCMVHGLTTVHKLEQHFAKHKEFKDTRRTSQDVNQELKRLLKRFTAKEDKASGEKPAAPGGPSPQYVVSEAQLHNSLQELQGEKPLSAKAFVFCMLNALLSLEKLEDYYAEYGTFLPLQNYDADIEKELVGVLRYHRSNEGKKELVEIPRTEAPPSKHSISNAVTQATLCFPYVEIFAG